jgi:hypothetical protein
MARLHFSFPFAHILDERSFSRRNKHAYLNLQENFRQFRVFHLSKKFSVVEPEGSQKPAVGFHTEPV